MMMQNFNDAEKTVPMSAIPAMTMPKRHWFQRRPTPIRSDYHHSLPASNDHAQKALVPETPLEAPAKAPHTDKIRLSPMRLCAIHASIRATKLPTGCAQPLQAAMQNVFMATTAYFHAHLETAMGPQVASALQRIRDAGQGLFVGQNALYVDLRQVAMSPAGKDASVVHAVQLAERALLTRVMS